MYRKFECEIKAKDYVLCDFLNYKQRSALSLARSGTLPVEIENGSGETYPEKKEYAVNAMLTQWRT